MRNEVYLKFQSLLHKQHDEEQNLVVKVPVRQKFCMDEIGTHCGELAELFKC